MGLIKRQQTFTYQVFDDQGPDLMKTYNGNWTHYTYPGFVNNTITATPNPGSTFSFSFDGSRAYLYGGLVSTSNDAGNNFTLSWPTAQYVIDGTPGGTQTPYFDTDNSSVIYFQTPQLANGTHTINVTVTGANDTSLYIIDYFLVIPAAGGDTSGMTTTRAAPSATSSTPTVVTQSTPVGAIVGGVVGGIAGIAIMALLAYYFLRKRSGGGRAYYFDKPTAADVLAGEDHVEPFNATTGPQSPPPTGGFNTPGPQSAYSDGSSQPLNPSHRQTVVSSLPSQYSQPAPSEGGMTYASGTPSQPRTGKAALIAQQHENVQQPVQYSDSGIRFNENGEQEPGPSQLPAEVPPSYTPN